MKFDASSYALVWTRNDGVRHEVAAWTTKWCRTSIIIFTIHKRSCGKVMFLHLFVILLTGGRCTPLGTHTPLDRHPLDRHTPYADTAPPGGSPPRPEMATAADGTHPTGMHSCFPNVTSGSPDNSPVLSPYSSAVIIDMDTHPPYMFLHCARLKPERNGMMNRPSGSLMPQKEKWMSKAITDMLWRFFRDHKKLSPFTITPNEQTVLLLATTPLMRGEGVCWQQPFT